MFRIRRRLLLKDTLRGTVLRSMSKARSMEGIVVVNKVIETFVVVTGQVGSLYLVGVGGRLLLTSCVVIAGGVNVGMNRNHLSSSSFPGVGRQGGYVVCEVVKSVQLKGHKI